MFRFLMDDIEPIEERRVDLYESEDKKFVVSTVKNKFNKYETAIKHPNYNNGGLIIVEEYDDIKPAEIGHNKWVVKIKKDNLPNVIEDVSSSDVAQFYRALGGAILKERA